MCSQQPPIEGSGAWRMKRVLSVVTLCFTTLCVSIRVYAAALDVDALLTVTLPPVSPEGLPCNL